MAEVKSYARLWPLAIAAVGVAGFVYAGIQWTGQDAQQAPSDPGEPDDPGPVTDAGPDEHFEKVRTQTIDEFTGYVGTVRAEGRVVVRAPQGMRVPILKVNHETGDFVKKGEVLVTFYRPQIDKAIEQARAAGNTADEQRFRGYLDSVELKSPVDGIVLSIDRTIGEVPIDEGLGIVTLADMNAFRFVVQVPGDVQRLSMALGTKFDVELEDDLGTVKGTVVEFEAPAGKSVPVVMGLAPHEGIEENLKGTVRVVSGRQEVGLVPKVAVQHRGDVAVVRVWEAGSISDKTVRLGEEVGTDVVILAGVYPDDTIVVPGPKRE